MKTDRTIAVFLIAGGLLGILNSAMIGRHFAQQHDLPRVLAAVGSEGLFLWCVLTGAALWRGESRGFRWAKILFALQVPVFSVARFSYEFSTSLSFRVMIGDTNHSIGANIGSSNNVFVSPESLGTMFGVNIVAALALLYLIRGSSDHPFIATDRLPLPLRRFSKI